MGNPSEALPVISIDAEHSSDLDDAFRLDLTENRLRLRVAIADPTRAVPIGSAVDRRAASHGATVYRGPVVVCSMLPKHLSSDRLSLSPGSSKPAFIVELTYESRNDSWFLIDTGVSQGLIENVARLTHDDVINILNDQFDLPEHSIPEFVIDEVKSAYVFAEKALESRRRQGALAIYTSKKGVVFDEEGKLVNIERKELAPAYVLVQELMIAVNEALSLFCIREDLPLMFRNHTTRASAPVASELTSQLSNALQTEDVDSVARLTNLLQISVHRARYSSRALGHYGLNLAAYSHFTSPLRRYSDLVNARVLSAHLASEEAPYTLSEIEELAEHLNNLYDIEKDKRSEGFRTRDNNKAIELMRDQAAIQDASHEILHRMIKAHQESDVYEAGVESELVRRLDGDTLPLKSIAYLIFDEKLPQQSIVFEAATRYLMRSPHHCTSIIDIAKNIFRVTEINTSAEPNSEGSPGFRASTTLVCGGEEYLGSVTGMPQKARALKAARLSALTKVMGTSDYKSDFDTAVASTDVTTSSNYKGLLLERVTKYQLDTPVFNTEKKGLDNAPVFTTTIRLRISDDSNDVLLSEGKASSKRESERIASKHMLRELDERPAVSQKKTVSSMGITGSQAISTLHEWHQSQRVDDLRFIVEQIGEQRFSCTVQVGLKSGGRTFTATARSKKEAKQEAALSAYAEVRRR